MEIRRVRGIASWVELLELEHRADSSVVGGQGWWQKSLRRGGAGLGLERREEGALVHRLVRVGAGSCAGVLRFWEEEVSG